MRLFIGIMFINEKNLISIQDILSDVGTGNFTPPSKLHVTLKFLGDVPIEKVAEICNSLETISINPFILECEHILLLGENNISAVKLKNQTGKLELLHAEIEAMLYKLGFEKDIRNFLPHVTLARGFIPTKNIDIEQLRFKECFISANEIALIESKSDKGRIIYEKVYSKTLG